MNTTTRRRRLEQLLELAQAYRGWGRKELARALGRDTTRLVPQSGLPKLDLLMDLAGALDWPIEEVAWHLRDEPTGSYRGQGELVIGELDVACGDLRPRSSGTRAARAGNGRGERGDIAAAVDAVSSFAAAEQAALAATGEGRTQFAIALARRAYELSGTPDERVSARAREAAGWTRLGHHLRALDAARRGLEENGATPESRLLLQTELAGQYLALWHLLEARSMAHDILERWEHENGNEHAQRAIEGMAFSVRGHSNRRLLAVETADLLRCATLAREDLARSRDLALEGAEEIGQTSQEGESLRGEANACLGGIIETEVVLGRCSAAEALDRFANGIEAIMRSDEARGEETAPASGNNLLRSAGWWCVYACNVVLRHLNDERAVQEQLAVFIDRARSISDRLDDWSLRERVMSLDDERRRRFMDWTSVEPECTLDRKGIRLITGIMGRFPRFQPTGWRILTAARIVVDNQVSRSSSRSVSQSVARPTPRCESRPNPSPDSRSDSPPATQLGKQTGTQPASRLVCRPNGGRV